MYLLQNGFMEGLFIFDHLAGNKWPEYIALFKSFRITFVQKGLWRPLTSQISFGDHFFLLSGLKDKIAFIFYFIYTFLQFLIVIFCIFRFTIPYLEFVCEHVTGRENVLIVFIKKKQHLIMR